MGMGRDVDVEGMGMGGDGKVGGLRWFEVV